jgi:hypothetical protein
MFYYHCIDKIVVYFYEKAMAADIKPSSRRDGNNGIIR